MKIGEIWIHKIHENKVKIEKITENIIICEPNTPFNKIYFIREFKKVYKNENR